MTVKHFEFFEHLEMAKANNTEHCFVSRCRPLGLTAYGDTQQESLDKLVRMFGSLVAVNFKYKKELKEDKESST